MPRQDGDPPLTCVKSTKMMDILLAAGANIEQTNPLGETPIFFMAEPVLIKLALKYGANPLHYNNEGKTALDIAAEDEVEYPEMKVLADIFRQAISEGIHLDL